mmetsp:Transcript_10107/g.25248  ORF Transcript_10107/g.25248 Transcript_10107/m.25248 type:complete len:209 (-) Transcript_10107:364-990(-)
MSGSCSSPTSTDVPMFSSSATSSDMGLSMALTTPSIPGRSEMSCVFWRSSGWRKSSDLRFGMCRTFLSPRVWKTLEEAPSSAAREDEAEAEAGEPPRCCDRERGPEAESLGWRGLRRSSRRSCSAPRVCVRSRPKRPPTHSSPRAASPQQVLLPLLLTDFHIVDEPAVFASPSLPLSLSVSSRFLSPAAGARPCRRGSSCQSRPFGPP